MLSQGTLSTTWMPRPKDCSGGFCIFSCVVSHGGEASCLFPLTYQRYLLYLPLTVDGIFLCVLTVPTASFPTEPVTREAHPYPLSGEGEQEASHPSSVPSCTVAEQSLHLQQCNFLFVVHLGICPRMSNGQPLDMCSKLGVKQPQRSCEAPLD
ncbi:hypothetical protein Taro_009503 [Colocasia esculenta]|uniref:Uncharacterized protein n=1 Tax=Colocasia esculenta TaxID=4460 RepID=A0A843U5V9_COLES|nr:hypothetical protein [Colocasia esculenta]